MPLSLLYSENIDAFLCSITCRKILNHLDESRPPKEEGGFELHLREVCAIICLAFSNLMTFHSSNVFPSNKQWNNIERWLISVWRL